MNSAPNSRPASWSIAAILCASLAVPLFSGCGGCGGGATVTLPTDPAPLPKPEHIRTTNDSGVKVEKK